MFSFSTDLPIWLTSKYQCIILSFILLFSHYTNWFVLLINKSFLFFVSPFEKIYFCLNNDIPKFELCIYSMIVNNEYNPEANWNPFYAFKSLSYEVEEYLTFWVPFWKCLMKNRLKTNVKEFNIWFANLVCPDSIVGFVENWWEF